MIKLFLILIEKLRYIELKRSICKYGIKTPVIATEDGRILDGNTRAKIAKELGYRVPTYIVIGRYYDDYPVVLTYNSDYVGQKERTTSDDS